MTEVLLQAKCLTKHFPVTKGLVFSKITGWVKAVDGVDFTITRGTTFGLVGESGCGKTTTARVILRLETASSGSLLFDEADVTKMAGASLRKYRSQVQAVFQDPYSSLNPRMRVGDIVAEPIVVNLALTRDQVKGKVKEMLGQVGLPPESSELYPHEFSGGQRQRIAVARALGINPSLVVLDEPVSALDVSIRAQLMNLLKELQATLGLTYLLIAHDLAVVRHMCSRIGVMYLGKIVELADADELYDHPLHPYTQALLLAALPSHPDTARHDVIITGEVPTPLNPPPGCHFHPRCPHAMPVCSASEPPLTSMGHGHEVACYLHIPHPEG
jgi:oligopeptide/dipeptide ABC transporter ATP-binding protein